jgi:hypothetical protein
MPPSKIQQGWMSFSVFLANIGTIFNRANIFCLVRTLDNSVKCIIIRNFNILKMSKKHNKADEKENPIKSKLSIALKVSTFVMDLVEFIRDNF